MSSSDTGEATRLTRPAPFRAGRGTTGWIVGLPSGRRTKYAVAAFWLIIVVLAGPLAGKLTGAEKNEARAWLPGSAESTKVLALQSRFQPPNVFTAVVVYERPAGLTGADRAKVAADARAFAAVPGVVTGQLAGPIRSEDGKAVETIVPVNLGQKGWNGAGAAATKLRTVAGANAHGLASHITGPLGNAADSANAFKGIDSTLLYATLAVVIVLLLVTYRSPALWVLPVLSAGVALITAQGLIYLLAAHAGLTVNGQSAAILLVLVFGAGTDYALLLTARYREELRRHADRHEAMVVALRRAGPAIIASAATVIASLLVLLVAELNSTSSLGPVLAIGIGVALAAMMTLLPALLLIFGRWIFWPAEPVYGSEEPTTRGLWARVGRRIAVRPRVVWVATAVILGAMTLGLTGLKASGLTTAESFAGHHPDSVAGQEVADRHLPAGAGSPVIVIGNQQQGTQLLAAVKAVPGITDVIGPVPRVGHAYLQGTLTTRPDSQAAYATIDKVRNAVHAVRGSDAMVGGNTAINLDIQRATSHDRKVIIPLILAVVFVILGMLLRALVAPIMLIATVVLSFAAALGVSALFFDHVFNFDGADTSFPLFAFVFLVALGIDYNIFLMTRVREETVKGGPRHGAITGLSATGAVITSAGAVLAGTFATLATLPVTFLAEMGFAVAFGVLLDAIVVRSVLVTALNLDLGRRLWWPSVLARRSSTRVPASTGPVTPAHPPRLLAGAWVLDPRKSSIQLKSRAVWGLAPVTGVFREISGNGTVSPDGEISGTVTVAAASINTKNTGRDRHLRSADFFDSGNYPDITFTADGIRPCGQGAAVTGALTVRGHTRPLSFDASASVPDDSEIWLDTEVHINRADFGLTWNRMGMVSMNIALTIHAVFTRR